MLSCIKIACVTSGGNCTRESPGKISWGKSFFFWNRHIEFFLKKISRFFRKICNALQNFKFFFLTLKFL